MMPPPGARRPDAATVGQSFVDALETQDRRRRGAESESGLAPVPAAQPRRSTQRAVRDLLGIDVDVTAFLPPDTISGGCDNVSDVQNFSPTLMEGYLRAASQISRPAVGDRNASPTSVTYKIGRTALDRCATSRARRWARAAAPSVVHVFPADGEYVVKMSMHNEPLGGISRPLLTMSDDGHQGAGRGLGQRRARGRCSTSTTSDERDRLRPERPRTVSSQTPPIHIIGRTAASVGGVHPAASTARSTT